jgi:AraC family transcriptional regulator
VDETNWRGPSQGIVVSIHPRLLTNALDETAHRTDVELKERWDLFDEHISALLHEMAADLDDGSPAGPIYARRLQRRLAGLSS